jgi:Domain of unknown function (DUF4389)
MSMIEHTAAYKRRDVWLRGLFMLIFMIGIGAAHIVWNVVAVVQFIWLLIAGQPNDQLSRFGATLAKWLSDAVRFLTFASDDKPFPWRDWPGA